MNFHCTLTPLNSPPPLFSNTHIQHILLAIQKTNMIRSSRKNLRGPKSTYQLNLSLQYRKKNWMYIWAQQYEEFHGLEDWTFHSTRHRALGRTFNLSTNYCIHKLSLFFAYNTSTENWYCTPEGTPTQWSLSHCRGLVHTNPRSGVNTYLYWLNVMYHNHDNREESSRACDHQFFNQM